MNCVGTILLLVQSVFQKGSEEGSVIASTVHGGDDARKEDHQESPQSSARWKGAYDSGRRVRAGRDGPHSRRQARSPVHQAGYRHRALQGAAVRSEIAASQKRPYLRRNKAKSGAGLRERPKRPSFAPVIEALCRSPASVKKRATKGSVPGSALQASQTGGEAAKSVRDSDANCGAVVKVNGSRLVGHDSAPDTLGTPDPGAQAFKLDDLTVVDKKVHIGSVVFYIS